MKMSQSCKKRIYTPERNSKISKALTGRKASSEHIRKNREYQINHPNRKFKDTSIELKIENLLKKNNIIYQKQVPLCKIAIVDFLLLNNKLVIQCDGDYWHNRPGARERDEGQDKVLAQNGYTVIRLWEHDINNRIDVCLSKINQYGC